MHVAMHMTYPERVSRYNIDKLRQCIINGMTRHPGANFVIFPDGNKWCVPLHSLRAPFSVNRAMRGGGCK